MQVGSGYNSYNYDPQLLKEKVVRVADVMLGIKNVHPFQTIAFRGSSGAALAYPLSVHTGWDILYIRKPGETSHSSAVMEGRYDNNFSSYIILDDTIDSGETCREIYKAINAHKDHCARPECAGIVLYNSFGRQEGFVIQSEPRVIVPVWGAWP